MSLGLNKRSTWLCSYATLFGKGIDLATFSSTATAGRSAVKISLPSYHMI